MDDLISKQAAIDMFQNLAHDDWNQGVSTTWANAFAESADMINGLSSSQRWIPVTERLPDEVGHYLCSFKEPLRIDRIHVDLAYWMGGQWYGYMADAITAWMPLPEPYKEEEETDRDYERAVEQLEHDILYEPTFNPDDGSM